MSQFDTLLEKPHRANSANKNTVGQAPQASATRTTSVPFLDNAQQDLLLAALNSQAPNLHSTGDTSQASPQLHNTMSTSFDPEFTPELYDFDGDDSFDFDNADLGGSTIGSLPGDIDHHEKRKADEDEDEGGDSKRQETQEGERSAKKPGRKPLTNEPTTKRKAQNRAAQRAFRERKEKHLKDLETQVSELTKSSEADKHENGILRAQVDRLQVELREYRKRLSLNSSGVNRSPPLAGVQATKNPMSFNFDFPKFGSLPGASILGNQSLTPPLSNGSPVGNQIYAGSRHNSEGRGTSPMTAQSQSRSPSVPANIDWPADLGNMAGFSTNDNLHGFASTLPQMGKSANDPFGDLFSPSILKTVKQDATQEGSYFNPTTITSQSNQATDQINNAGANGGDSTAGIPDHRVFRFNSNSIASDTASPSTSSLSQWNQNATNSSCGTSPEPVVDSPANMAKSPNTIQLQSKAQSQAPASQQYSFTQLPSANGTDANFDSFSVPQLDSFDPVLFGDYRDTSDNIVGTGDFTGGFFDSDLGAPLDLGSPSNLFGILTNSTASPATAPSQSLMAQIEKARDGADDDFTLPHSQVRSPAVITKDGARNPASGKLVSCTKIWNQLQSNPDFQDGKFDLDGLCSELRTKARCSESGLMVDANHVDAALKKIGASPVAPSGNTTKLMFEQESWDSVLKKMSAAKQA